MNVSYPFPEERPIDRVAELQTTYKVLARVIIMTKTKVQYDSTILEYPLSEQRHLSNK